MGKSLQLIIAFHILTFSMVLLALYLIFAWVPTEINQGVVQRIFYFHVPSAWVAFLGFFMAFIGSIGYVITRRDRWDAFAVSSVEVGMIFCTIVLVTGPLWAKPIWGVFWTWDARLTSTLLLWLIFMGYLLVRVYAMDQNKKSILSAIIAIVGFLDVPIVYFSIRWWRTLHPQPIFAGDANSGLAPDIRTTFLVSLGSITLLFLLILYHRYRLETARQAVDHAYRQQSIQE